MIYTPETLASCNWFQRMVLKLLNLLAWAPPDERP